MDFFMDVEIMPYLKLPEPYPPQAATPIDEKWLTPGDTNIFEFIHEILSLESPSGVPIADLLWQWVTNDTGSIFIKEKVIIPISELDSIAPTNITISQLSIGGIDTQT